MDAVVLVRFVDRIGVECRRGAVLFDATVDDLDAEGIGTTPS